MGHSVVCANTMWRMSVIGYRVQLAACVSAIIKNDYPEKWPGIADKIVTNMESDKHSTWLGSLVCLYQLVKNFESVSLSFWSLPFERIWLLHRSDV